jgi:hypothetical protein
VLAPRRLAVLLPIALLASSLCRAGDANVVLDARPPAALNVTIAVFDPGLPEDEGLYRDLQIFPRIRSIESMFLPFVLRETLAATGEWGAVRVVPAADPAAELLVSGRIVHSDGDTLQLAVRAVDASGRVWVDRVFDGAVVDAYSPRNGAVPVPAQQQIFDAIAAQLVVARGKLTEGQLSAVVDISMLRYAAQLAPSAFGNYLHTTDDGLIVLDRLPARDDPMLARIDRLRRTEYVITDAVDAKFRELHAEIASVYDVWREYRRKAIGYRADDAKLASDPRSIGERGSYEALKSVYDNYKSDRIIDQELDRLAVAFNNEVGPTITAMEERVAELRGWVDERYVEWNRILEELFEVETGQAAAPD